MKRALFAFLLAGCAGERPACSAAEYARLEASYVAEVLTSCDGYATPEECPTYPAIRDKYKALREAWRTCK